MYRNFNTDSLRRLLHEDMSDDLRRSIQKELSRREKHHIWTLRQLLRINPPLAFAFNQSRRPAGY